VRRVIPGGTELKAETFLLETLLSERAIDGPTLRIVRKINPLDPAPFAAYNAEVRRATLHTIGVARRTCTQENVKFGLEGSFCGSSYRKNASEGLLRVIFRSYAAGEPECLTQEV
jgi:hypothetical protein